MTDPTAEPSSEQRLSMRQWLALAYTARYRNALDVVLVWCVWMLAAWIVWAGDAWYAITTVFSRGDWAGPAVRWMAVAAMLGVCLLWPVVRLGQRHPLDDENLPLQVRGIPRDRRVRQLSFALRDWVSLSVVFLSVCWPLWYLGHWQRDQTLWIAGAVTAWGAVIGLIVAVGRWDRSAVSRTLAMLLCVLIVFGEPMVIGLAARMQPAFEAWSFVISPLQVIGDLAAARSEGAIWSARQMQPHLLQTLGVGAAAVLGWIVAFTWALLTRDALAVDAADRAGHR